MSKYSGTNNSRFSPERRARFLEAISGGNFRVTACKLAGISHPTLSAWRQKAEKAIPPGQEGHDPVEWEYAEFFDEVIRLEAECEARMVACIQNAALADPRHWQAAAKYLSVKHSRRWSEGRPADLKTPEDKNIPKALLLERLEAAADALRKELKEENPDEG